MSENKSRFRIKKGDIEIEFEGTSSEVAPKFENVLEWIKTAPVRQTGEETVVTAEIQKQEKPQKRGGARTGVIAPAIDELVKEGFLTDFKTASQVLEELRRKTVPVSDVARVIMAMNRRVPKTLERIKDNQGRWVYRKKS